MKKLLLTPALLFAISSANAQLALENFNAPGIPAGWTMINDGKTPSSVWTATVISGLTKSAYMKWQEATGDSAMLTVSAFTPSVAADRWLITPSFNVTSADMLISWYDLSVLTLTSTGDNIEIWVSTTGGATKADFTTKLGSRKPGETSKKVMASLAAFNGMNVRVGFRSAAKDGGGFLLDDIQTEIIPAKTDAQNDGITFPQIAAGTSSTPVSMMVTNNGTTNITSVQASYVVDAGTPVTQTFSGLNILPGDNISLSFTTGATGFTIGAHTLTCAIIQVNGAVDADAANNAKTVNFTGASKSVSRSGLMEEFTSSTCAPCASFNNTFDPLILSEKANDPASRFNIIKYQMNWPSPGNDVSYNAQGNTRRGYYGVSGIPDHYTNGGEGGAGNKGEIDNSKVDPSYMDIAATYTIKGDSLIADVTVTPYFTSTGTYKVHMAGTEYHYTNSAATTTQKEYYHVMRNMAGSGSGISVSSWTDKTPQKFRWAHKWTTGTVTQGSNTYWDHPSKNANLVVFVQEESKKSVMQSQSAPAKFSVGIKTDQMLISDVSVYPNPATDRTSLAFQMTASSYVGIQVLDMTGRVVYNVAEQPMSAGIQNIEIPTGNLSAGAYMIKVSAKEGTVTERFSVVK